MDNNLGVTQAVLLGIQTGAFQYSQSHLLFVLNGGDGFWIQNLVTKNDEVQT
jgi:hypothetical protein